MADALNQLWRIATRQGAVDARSPFDALAAGQTAFAHADVRTRMLIRDTLAALKRHYGDDFQREAQRRGFSTPAPSVPADAGDVGFPSLAHSVVDVTDPNGLFDLLRDLSRRVHEPCSITIGGSLALMLDDLVARLRLHRPRRAHDRPLAQRATASRGGGTELVRAHGRRIVAAGHLTKADNLVSF